MRDATSTVQMSMESIKDLGLKLPVLVDGLDGPLELLA